MKIGIDARIATTNRGMGRALPLFLKEIAALDTETSYILYTGPTAPSELPKQENFRVRRLSSGFIPFYEQILLPAAARRDGVDLLWCPANTGPVRCQVPLVVTLHDVAFRHRGTAFAHSPSAYQRLGRTYTDWSASSIVRKAKQVVTDSESSAKEIRELLGVSPDRLEVIHLALTLQTCDATSLPEAIRQDPDSTPFIFCLGATDPRKNTSFTIDAFLSSTLAERCKLVIAGLNPTDRAAISSRLASHPNAGSVVTLDYITDAELAGLYRECLFFVFPSVYEGFGLPVLEAMQYGAAVIGSNKSSVPEVGGDAILYFDPTSRSSLVERLETVAADEELRARLRAAGRERARHFSWRASAERMIKVFREATS